MRRILVLAALLAVLPTATAQDPWPPGHHSPSVASFAWEPTTPDRGETVHARLQLREGVAPEVVVLRACRVEAYSCLQPILMEAKDEPAAYGAEVPWGPFFRDARTVGLSVLLRHANGTEEKTPQTDWPARPESLPAEADVYYYYALPAAEPAPALPLLGVLAAAFVAVAWRRPS